MGDFNINTISEFTGTTPQCQQFTNIFLAHYYRKLIHLPTRVSGNSRSILDNIYTNHPLSEENGVNMTDITDHYLIFTVCEDLIYGQFNFLGLIISSDLKWHKHIEHISLKISKVIGIMCCIKSILQANILLTMYNALIMPHFNYCLLA